MFEDSKNRAWKLFEAKEYAAALDLFQDAANTAPDSDEHAAALIGLSRCLEILGRYAEARVCLRDAVRLGPSDPEYMARVAFMDAGLDALEGNDHVALAKLNKILEAGGSFLKSECRDLYQGIQVMRAGRLQNLKRHKEALPLFLESEHFEIEKPSDYRYRAAYCLAECGDAGAAQAIIAKALESGLDTETECTARYYLALVYATQGKYHMALKELQFCEQHLDRFLLSIPILMESLSWTSEKLGRSADAARYRRAAGGNANKS